MTRGGAPLRDVFGVFLRLGLTAFGGPIAHLGYFRTMFVERLRWVSEEEYADLIALCQFLPGPTSSQVGFAIGLKRAGLAGGLMAWCGFTLPSAVLLMLFAQAAENFRGGIWDGLVHGLKLVAVAVVAQAIWGMARTLCPDLPRAALALAALVCASLIPGTGGQLAAIVVGVLGGLALNDPGGSQAEQPVEASAAMRRRSAYALGLFFVLLALPPLLANVWSSPALQMFSANYGAGALVFGGGHVVLPLLESALVPAFMNESTFLAGYGAVQAVPGPLFTFSAYLGTVSGGIGVGFLALVAIFLPGLLLVLAAFPFWHRLRHQPGARRILTGVNAAVVGLLGAALYDPIWTSAVLGRLDFVLAACAFFALILWRAPAILVVSGLAITGLVRGAVGL